MGLIGMVAGGVAGWFLSRRGRATSDHGNSKSAESQRSADPHQAVEIEGAVDADAQEEVVIDLRDSQVVTTLQSELRRARSRIDRLQRSNAELEAAVRRKDQAVVEARNTLLAVQHSLAQDQAKRINAVGSPPADSAPADSAPADSTHPIEAVDVRRPPRVGAFPPDDGFGDIQDRLRAVTGELAEVNRRHQKGQ